MGGQAPLRKPLWVLRRRRRVENVIPWRGNKACPLKRLEFKVNLCWWLKWADGFAAGFPKCFLSGACPPIGQSFIQISYDELSDKLLVLTFYRYCRIVSLWNLGSSTLQPKNLPMRLTCQNSIPGPWHEKG